MASQDSRRSVGGLLAAARAYLRECGSESPGLDAEVLLAHCLGAGRLDLYRAPDRIPDSGQASGYLDLIARRGRGEPVAYLTGHKEFMGLDLAVGPPVLIPRPETELLVEQALELLGLSLAERPGGRLAVDVGAGSGAIAVSLAVFMPRVRVLATDISGEALAVARRNAARHGVARQVSFFQGDLLTPLTIPALQGQVDLVAANLPYIPAGDLEALPRDVRAYEPRLALNGGPDGLSLYRRLVPDAGRLLRPGGFLLMEIGPGQGRACLGLVPAPVWESVLLPDLAGRERLVVARKA